MRSLFHQNLANQTRQPPIHFKFIPLQKTITFFNLALLLPSHKKFKPDDFQKFFQLPDLEADIDTWLKQFHPFMDQSLEGDIYSQNQKRARSIVEEVSNSIDAMPSAIHCIIRDGYYEVREIEGMGMTPEIICTKYFPPKATSKTHSDKQIGRFGIGSFTKLAHLNDAMASVIVETRAIGSIGCRIEYRLIDGQLMVNMREDASIAHGTVTKVTSTEIIAKDYEAILQANISSEVTIPIFINGCILMPDTSQPEALITINNICIARQKQPEGSVGTFVLWKLPPGTTISESRNKIIVDNKITHQAIVQYIDQIKTRSFPEWVRYANTIAALVKELQTTNTSIIAADNLLDYLIRVTQDRLGTLASVPDIPLYKPLVTSTVVPLHPILLPQNWLHYLATAAREFSEDQTAVFIADFACSSEDMPFIHDQENDHVIVSKSWYEHLKQDNNLRLLELIFTYPPGEIQAKLVDHSVKQTDKRLQVTFHPDLVQQPLHALYQQHGTLWQYGDEATTNILTVHENAWSILKQAKSLIVRAVKPENMQGKLVAISWQDKRYYCSSTDSHVSNPDAKFLIFDACFQQLTGKKWQLIANKAYQLFDNETYSLDKAWDLDVRIDIRDDDIFAVQDEQTRQYRLCNGKGETFGAQHPYLKVRPLDEHYYLVISRISPFKRQYALFHRQDGLCAEFPNDCYGYKKLPGTELVAGYEEKICVLFDLKTMKLIQPDINQFLRQGDYLLGIQTNLHDESYFFGSSYKQLYFLMTLSGEVIAKLEIKLDSAIKYFVCEKCSDHAYNISLLEKCGVVHFVQINQGKQQYFSPDQTVGFPVNGLMTGKKCAKKLRSLSNESIYPHSLQFKKKYVNHTDSVKNFDDEASVAAVYSPSLKPVLYNGKTAIFDMKTLHLYLLDKTFDLEQIHSVLYYRQKYISMKQNDQTLLFNLAGQYLVQAKSLYVYSTIQGDIIELNEDTFVLPNGKQLHFPGYRYARVVSTAAGPLIKLSVYDNKNSEHFLYDMEGNLRYQGNEYIHEEKDHPNYYTIGSDLYTPFGKIEKGSVFGFDNHSLPTRLNEFIFTSRDKMADLLTKSGYPFYNEPIPEHPYLLAKRIISLKPSIEFAEKSLIYPLTCTQLANRQTLDNLAYLNCLDLSVARYSECLRFIDWPLGLFQKIVPHIEYLRFTPTFGDAILDYEIIIDFAERLAAKDGALVLCTFNCLLQLLNGRQEEPIAEKLIRIVEYYGLQALDDCYKMLCTHQKAFMDVSDFLSLKKILDEFTGATGMIGYYLFFPEQQLLSSMQPCFSPLVAPHQISLMAFMTAFQFNSQLLTLIDRPEQFIQAIHATSYQTDQSQILRILQHAIYHQASPNQHLYERELLQNALDAYAGVGIQGDKAEIPVHVYREKSHCVFRIENVANGMRIEDVFYYFALVGTSSKRHDRHQHFIGGHGVGAFTIYHDAAVVRLKTGKNDGAIYCFEFHPVYDGTKIIDIQIQWEKQPGFFDGVIIERVDRNNNPTLAAASHHRSFKTHAKTIDANVAKVTFNGKQINQSLLPLASIAIPDIGKMTLFSSIEDMITVAGLCVRPIHDIDHFVPEAIRKIVRKKGLIIDLPKSIPLNRERTEIIDADRVYHYLRPYLLNAYIEVYLRLFMQNNIALDELPYDFFERFEVYLKNMKTHNPALLQDVENIKKNLPLADYNPYQSSDKLHELMAWLPLFKVREIQDDKKEYTLIELAQYYQEKRRLPDLIHTPECLYRFIEKYENTLAGIEYQTNFALTVKDFPQIDFIPNFNTLPLSPWKALLAISEQIANYMGYAMQFGFSTQRSGDLLHTRRDTHYIYWNIYALADPRDDMAALFKDLSKQRPLRFLNKLIDNVAHELVHAKLEETCSITHNRTFSLKQRKLLVDLSKNISLPDLEMQIRKLYVKCVDLNKPFTTFDAQEFIQSQFFVKDKALTLFGLFGGNPSFGVNDSDSEELITDTAIVNK